MRLSNLDRSDSHNKRVLLSRQPESRLVLQHMYSRHSSSQAPAYLQNNTGKPQVVHCAPFSNRSNFNILSTAAGAELSDDDEMPHPVVMFHATPLAGPQSYHSATQTAVPHPHVLLPYPAMPYHYPHDVSNWNYMCLMYQAGGNMTQPYKAPTSSPLVLPQHLDCMLCNLSTMLLNINHHLSQRT